MVEGPRGRDYGKDNLIMEKHLKKLTLLHSNDMHGDFMTEELDNKLVGGVSMLSGYISEVRAKEKNTLYCIAGDMFTGSIIDSEYKGMSTIELMNIIDPDVVTLGNHEVDYGLAHLLFIEKCANFPIINANMYIKSNHARLFQPMHIAHLDGMKILFIGVLTEETLAKTSQDEIGAFINIKEAGKEVDENDENGKDGNTAQGCLGPTHTVLIINMFQRQAEQEPCEQGAGDQGEEKVAAVKENSEPQGNAAGDGNRKYSDDVQNDGPHGRNKTAEEELSPAGKSGIPLIAKVMRTDDH